MVNYDKPTGTAGTLRITDTGTVVEFWILCGDGATNVGSLTWSGKVNGVNVGGTTSWPAGTGSKRVGSWTVSSPQTVTFHMNATGTQGLGGPTDHSASIARGSAPGAPGPTKVSALTLTGATFSWGAAAANGSAITQYGLYISESSTFASHAYQAWVGAVLTKTLSGILIPGRQYYARNRAQNARGTGPYNAAVAFRPLSGIKVSSGGVWKEAEVWVSTGSAWKAGELQRSDGTAWGRPT